MTMTRIDETQDEGGFAAPADSALPGWLAGLPKSWQPYAMLSRIDRPVGVWLLFLPCVMGLGFARFSTGLQWIDALWIVLFLIGAVVMRGAGCTWNDITDRDFDGKVARTANRPLPSGAVTLSQAYMFLAAQLATGGIIWLTLPWAAKIAALLALPLVAIYPFAKRVTWWPQAWLGLTFNWGVFVGAATANAISHPVYILYFGLVLWTIAYDTIYALQDREDDALIGVRSTARLFGERAVLISFCFHLGAAALIAAAAFAQGLGRIGALTALAFLLHGCWQAIILKTRGEEKALQMFRANVQAGAIVATGFLIAAFFSPGYARPALASATNSASSSQTALPIEMPPPIELRHAPPRAEIWFVTDLEKALKADADTRKQTPATKSGQ